LQGFWVQSRPNPLQMGALSEFRRRKLTLIRHPTGCNEYTATAHDSASIPSVSAGISSPTMCAVWESRTTSADETALRRHDARPIQPLRQGSVDATATARMLPVTRQVQFLFADRREIPPVFSCSTARGRLSLLCARASTLSLRRVLQFASGFADEAVAGKAKRRLHGLLFSRIEFEYGSSTISKMTVPSPGTSLTPIMDRTRVEGRPAA